MVHLTSDRTRRTSEHSLLMLTWPLCAAGYYPCKNDIATAASLSAKGKQQQASTHKQHNNDPSLSRWVSFVKLIRSTALWSGNSGDGGADARGAREQLHAPAAEAAPELPAMQDDRARAVTSLRRDASNVMWVKFDEIKAPSPRRFACRRRHVDARNTVVGSQMARQRSSAARANGTQQRQHNGNGHSAKKPSTRRLEGAGTGLVLPLVAIASILVFTMTLRNAPPSPPPPPRSRSDAIEELKAAVAAGDEPRTKALLRQTHNLVAATDSVGNAALHVAVVLEQPAMVALLLTHGAPIATRNMLGDTAFLVAVKSTPSSEPNRATVRLLLEATLAQDDGSHGASMREALFNAAAAGRSELVPTLLDAALDVHNAAEDGSQQADSDKLALAAISGDEEVVRALLDGASSSLDTAQNGITALHLAVATAQRVSLVRLLLGSDPSSRYSADVLWACLFVSLHQKNGARTPLVDVLRDALPDGSGPGIPPPEHALFQRATWDGLNISNTETMADAWRVAADVYSIRCNLTLSEFWHPSMGMHVRGVATTHRIPPFSPICRVPLRTHLSLQVMQLTPLAGVHSTCVRLMVVSGGAARWCDVLALSILALHEGLSPSSYLLPLVRIHLLRDGWEADSLPLAWEETSAELAQLNDRQAIPVQQNRWEWRQTVETALSTILATHSAALGDVCNGELCTPDGLREVYSTGRVLHMGAIIHARVAGSAGLYFPVTAMNHPPKPPERTRTLIKFNTPDHTSNSVVFFTEDKTLKAGEEVFYDYSGGSGGHCKEKFFTTYGFAPGYLRPCSEQELRAPL